LAFIAISLPPAWWSNWMKTLPACVISEDEWP